MDEFEGVKEDESGNIGCQQTSAESASLTTSCSSCHDNIAGKDLENDKAHPRHRPIHLLKNSNKTHSGQKPVFHSEFESVRLANVDCQDLLFRIAEFEKSTCKPMDHINNKMDCNLSESSVQPSTSRCSSHENVKYVTSAVCNNSSYDNFGKSSMDCNNGQCSMVDEAGGTDYNNGPCFIADKARKMDCNTGQSSMVAKAGRMECNNGQNCERHVCPECGMSSRDSGLKFCGKASCIGNDKEGVQKCSMNSVLTLLDKGDIVNMKQSVGFPTGVCNSNIGNSCVNDVFEDTAKTAAHISVSHKNLISTTSPKKTNLVTDFLKVNEEFSPSVTVNCGHKRTFDGEIGIGFDSCSTKVVKYQSESETNIAGTDVDVTKLFKIKKITQTSESRHSNNPGFVKLGNSGLVFEKLRNESSSNVSGTSFNNEADGSFQVSDKEINGRTDSSKASCIKSELNGPQTSPIPYSTNNMADSVPSSTFQNDSEIDCHTLFKGHGQKVSDINEFDSENDVGYPLHASKGSLNLQLRDNFPSVSCNNDHLQVSVPPISNESESLYNQHLPKTCVPGQLLPLLPQGTSKKDHLKLLGTVFGTSASTSDSVNEHIHIDCLPTPLILHIFGFLSLYDVLLRASLVCRKWLSHTKDSALWRAVDLSEQIKVDNCVLTELTSRSDKVVHLDISDSKLVTNEGFIQVLGRCHHLHTLKIVRCHQLSGEGLQSIGRSCHGLTDLWMDNCYGLCDSSLKTIAEGCSQLRVLRMGQCSGITNSGLEALAEGCPLLKVLMLDHCTMVSDGGLQKVIENCPQLEELSLMACNFSDQIVLLFTRLINLKKLDISNNVSVSKATIMEIAKQCCNLRVFGLSLIRGVDDECLHVVAKHARNLERLHVVSCNLSDKALKSLGRHCKKLNSLDVGWCGKITDRGVRKISELCPLLTYLGLIRCDNVTAWTIEELMRLYPAIKFSTFKLESRLLLERARLEGFISEDTLNRIKSQR